VLTLLVTVAEMMLSSVYLSPKTDMSLKSGLGVTKGDYRHAILRTAAMTSY